MPESEQTIAGIAEDVGRGDQPQSEHDFGHLLPTLQGHILKLGEAEYHHADRKRIQDHQATVRIDKLMALLGREPWRQHDEQAKQHATPVFPCSMGVKKTKVRHCKPPLKRGIRQRLASMTLRLSSDQSGRIGGRMSSKYVGEALALARPGQIHFVVCNRSERMPGSREPRRCGAKLCHELSQ